MTSRLTTRSDTPTATGTDRITVRIGATQTICRTKAGKPARSKHVPKRTVVRAAEEDGATMSYQQGFTSGPSM